MIGKNEIVQVLEKHLGSDRSKESIQKLAQELVALEKDWEELQFEEEEMGYTMKVDCGDICFLAEQIQKGATVRIFRKRVSSSPAEDKYAKHVLKG